MGIKRLVYFSRIAELGSVKAAADEVRISQPSLSRQVRMLEEELGIKLFKRLPRGMQLTEEGEKLQARIAEPLRQIELALKEARSPACGEKVRLYFGLPATVGHMLAGPLTRRVISQAPDIEIRIVEHAIGDLISKTNRGEIDLAILLGPVSDWPSMGWAGMVEGMVVEDLLCEELVLVGSSDCDLDPERAVVFDSIGGLPLVLSSYPNQPSKLRKKLKTLADHSGTEFKRYISDSFQLTKDLVESGLAYAFLPYSSISHNVESGRIKYAPIRGTKVTRQLVLVTNPHSQNIAAVEKLKSLVHQEITALVAAGKWDVKPMFRC